MTKRLFPIAVLVLAIFSFCASVEGQSNPPLRITEADGSPSKVNATRLNFPNGTLSISGGVVTYTPAGGSGLGDVVGPAAATDNAVVRFDLTTGKLVQNSVVTIADTSGNMAGVGTLNTHTIPGGTDTFALLAATQNLTGKTYNKITITAPATGATLTIPDGVTLNAGAGGTLGSNAFTSTAFVPQTTTVNGKALSGNITLGLASADFANQGTTTTVLHGNAAGNPSFGAVSLTADVSGILPTANGGTGIAFFTAAGPTVARVYTFPDAAATVLTTNAAVTVAQGGTGLATLTANNVMLGNGTSTPLFVAPGTSGNVLTSNGTTWTSAAAAGGGGSPGGSGSEIQFRGGASTFSAVTGSSVSGAAISLAGVLTNVVDSATTNAGIKVFDIQASSSGTPAAGFGPQLRFGAETSTTANQDIAIITPTWVDATHASRRSNIVFGAVTQNQTLSEIARLEWAVDGSPQLMFTGATASWGRPQLAIGGQTTGIVLDAANTIGATFAGTGAWRSTLSQFALNSGAYLGWSSGDPAATGTDVRFDRVTTAVVKLTTDGSAGAAFQFPQKAANPANPGSSAEVNFYIKGSKIVFQYNDAGTVRYVTYDLTQTGTSVWATSTSAP